MELTRSGTHRLGNTHATVRQIVRHIADAGFIPAERDPYYNIKQYPDVQAILNEKPPVALPLA